MTKLYAFDCEDEPLPEQLAVRLPAWRLERFERLKNAQARQESLSAGLLYAYAMRSNALDPEAPVTILPAGKPVREDVYFSLSHSGRYALCAVGDGPVGADVQIQRPIRLSVSRRFHPDEQAWLARQPENERQEALFRLWTRKEAWVKAVSGQRMLTLSEADVLHPMPELYFRDYSLPGGYAAALCAADADLPNETQYITRRQLLAGTE